MPQSYAAATIAALTNVNDSFLVLSLEADHLHLQNDEYLFC